MASRTTAATGTAGCAQQKAPREPPLTTISLQPSRIGRQAAQLLLRLIQGDPQAKNIVIEPVLKVRGSTARRVIGD